MAYAGTIKYLYGLQRHGIKLGLENPRRLLSLFGDPQGDFRAAHVAGTNGKGSTAAALASMLRSRGMKTGLFTSPHIVSFTERIMVDCKEISRGEVVALADEIRAASAGLEPTFFEVVTVMGFLYFKRMGVDWAVVETGMGGRLDATNVLLPEVSIITTVDMDHREFLGGDIASIASEKAGIIKPGVPVVSANQKARAMEVLERAAGGKGSPLHVEGREFTCEIKALEPGRVVFDYISGDFVMKDLVVPLSGAYQARNASLAVRAFEIISGEPSRNALNEKAVREGLANLRWPGRLELISQDPPVFMDGAHNPGAARALADNLRENFLAKGKKLTLVLGIMSDKDIPEILGPLLPLASEVIFAAPDSGRAARPEALRDAARGMGFASRTAPTVKDALRMACALGNMVLVTGSFYTMGEAREALGARGFLTGLREWQARR